MLPYKDTALENRIKNHANVSEGNHTVSVVSGRFYQLDGTCFGNVGLKLKLSLEALITNR